MAMPLFWCALISQLIIVLGYFWFYRKEQLCKSCHPPITDKEIFTYTP
jgi:alpha-1,3-glucan synthase